MSDPIIKKNSVVFDTAHNIQTEADVANKTADVYNLVTGEKYAASDAITVESKSITENGTYTAPAGKAYSPVTVNVEGGGGDFSTAEVVVTNPATVHEIVSFIAPVIINDKIETGFDVGNNTITETIVLYKGSCEIYTTDADTGEEIPSSDIAVTGDISVDEYGVIIVTGSGTITITAIEPV